MEKNGFERAAAALVSHSTLSHLNGAHRQESSAPEGQQLSKGVGRPPLEAEYSGRGKKPFSESRDQMRHALAMTPRMRKAIAQAAASRVAAATFYRNTRSDLRWS